MQGIIDCVSEALDLDTQGSPDLAVHKYLECLDMILRSPEPSDQTKKLATNCLDRIKVLLANTRPQQHAPAHDSPLRRSSGDVAAKRQDDNGHKRTPSLTGTAAATLASSTVSPSLLLHQPALFQQKVKILLSGRQQRRQQLLTGSRIFDWSFSSSGSSSPLSSSSPSPALALSSIAAILSRPPFSTISAEEQRILEALGTNNTDSVSAAVFHFLAKRREHPVVLLTADFVKRLYHLASGKEGVPNRQTVADEMCVFTSHFVTWFERQWNLPPGKYLLGIELGLQEYLLSTAIYPLLIKMYCNDAATFGDGGGDGDGDGERENKRKYFEIGWEKLSSSLQMSFASEPLSLCYERFPICSDPKFVHPALSNLSMIPSSRTPQGKLFFLLRTCSELCRAFPQEEIGGEDLMRLLCLVLLRCPNGWLMYGEAAFMADLAPESLLRGECGYVLATLQSALDFIGQLQDRLPS